MSSTADVENPAENATRAICDSRKSQNALTFVMARLSTVAAEAGLWRVMENVDFQPFQNGRPRSIWRGLLTMPTPAPTSPPTITPGGPPIRPIPAPIPAPESPRSPIAVPQPASNVVVRTTIRAVRISIPFAESKRHVMAKVPAFHYRRNCASPMSQPSHRVHSSVYEFFTFYPGSMPGFHRVNDKHHVYRAYAAFCQRMSHESQGDDRKVAWLRLAADWLALIRDSSSADPEPDLTESSATGLTDGADDAGNGGPAAR